MSYDVIGDIHGQADKLEALLKRLGYVFTSGSWHPPDGRRAVFVGDLIDTGPQKVRVIKIVRAMIDAGNARAAMGNHELNAIGYWTRSWADPDCHLRPRGGTNLAQHQAFLDQVDLDSPLHGEMVSWFKTLPLVLNLHGIRVVHAWWHQPHVDRLSALIPAGQEMTDEVVQKVFADGSPEFVAIEGLTKGLEIPLPAGYGYVDHSGVFRDRIRAQWWNASVGTYRDVAMVSDSQRQKIPALPLADAHQVTPLDGSPVFIGHYWMTGRPALLTPKLACVDWSAAKHGPLVAYRWDGESELDGRRFVASDCVALEVRQPCPAN